MLQVCLFITSHTHTHTHTPYRLYFAAAHTRSVLLAVCGWRTSVVSGLAAVGSLTGSRQRVPQGPDGRVLDPQRRTHQQQHRLPGALHPAPPSGSTSFTLPPRGRHTHTHTHKDRHTMRFHFDAFSLTHVELRLVFMPAALCCSDECSCSRALKQWRVNYVPLTFPVHISPPVISECQPLSYS